MRSADFLVLLGLGMFCYAMGGFVAVKCNDKFWMKECIVRGVAQYNPKTSEFEWVVEPIKPEKESK